MSKKTKVKDLVSLFKVKGGNQVKSLPLKEGLNAHIRLVKDINELEVEEKPVGKKQEMYVYIPLYNDEGDYIEKVKVGTVTPNGVLILTEEFQQFKSMNKDKVYNIYVKKGMFGPKKYTIREVVLEDENEL